jgi:single-strand DNA-binding protein
LRNFFHFLSEKGTPVSFYVVTARFTKTKGGIMNVEQKSKSQEARQEAVERLDKKLMSWWSKYSTAENERSRKMTGFNRVVLMGNLTRDPKVRQIPSGASVADLGLAASETYKSKNGETVETTCFVDIVTWGRQAETCGEYLKKGSPVLVEGRLQLDQWESPEGEKRSKMRVRADKVKFLGKSNNGGSHNAEAGKAESAAVSAEHDEALPF